MLMRQVAQVGFRCHGRQRSVYLCAVFQIKREGSAGDRSQGHLHLERSTRSSKRE